MNYTLIGTGNMAWFLASHFQEAGFKCDGVYGRDIPKGKELSAFLKTGTISDPADIPDKEGTCILAVSDDAIAPLSQFASGFRQLVVMHTSGALPADILPCLHRGVLWPVYSIGRNRLPGNDIPVVVEASSPEAASAIRILALACTEEVFHLSADQKSWLHLGAVIGNNFITHLVSILVSLCREQQLPVSLLMPILRQTTEQILTAETSPLLQTGPAARKDTTTLRRHADMLRQHPLWKEVYETISASIAGASSAPKTLQQ